ncbi:MAG: hypothetical protein ABI199_05705 [Bacteroidia bacterium]
MKTMVSKKLLLFSTLILCYNCYAQQLKNAPSKYLYGKWKCVKLDARGYENLTPEQARKLQASILTVEKHTYYYNNISFIEWCNFDHWIVTKYDTVNLDSQDPLVYTYTTKELSKIKVIEPVDSIGKFGCVNDCAAFYLKGDTLLNDCGGYYFYFTKVKEVKNETIPIDGDTVRCIYGNRCGSTGYVIQGTRATGHAVHVRPVNKNVPMEQVSKKDLKKEEEK